MNLEELRSVQDAERKRSDLQPLRESFYEEAGEYIASLKARRDEAASEAADPFSSPEVRRLTDEIETAEEVVEAVYERRLGKLVERASLAASEMSVEEEGLTAEEQELFHDLVARMEASKRTVLETLDPEPDSSSRTNTPDRNDDAGEGVSAADLMGGDDTTASGGGPTDRSPSSNSTPDSGSPTGDTGRGEPSSAGDAPGRGTDTARADTGSGTGSGRGDPAPPDGSGPGGHSSTTDPGHGESVDGDAGAGGAPAAGRNGHGGTSAGADAGAESRPDSDRVTVRITRDVGQILGVDDRQYDLAAEDVVQLPATNADPLVERGAAERLD